MHRLTITEYAQLHQQVSTITFDASFSALRDLKFWEGRERGIQFGANAVHQMVRQGASGCQDDLTIHVRTSDRPGRSSQHQNAQNSKATLRTDRHGVETASGEWRLA